MSRARPAAAALAFVAGAVFAVGLVLAGMTQPTKVLAFLDVGGAWDPTLAFVMGGAVLAHLAGLRLVAGRGAPLFADAFARPPRTDLDLRLLAGAAIFGVGWGLAGYCPGPALTSLGGGGTDALVFVGAATVGMLLERAARRSPVSP